MNRKAVSGIMLTLLLIGMLTLAFNIQPAKASGMIYIRADGSVDPPTAPIERDGDLYTLTDDIFSDTDGIVIERSNMTLDGAGYTLEGPETGESKGIKLSGRSNVTIKNIQIKKFGSGIHLYSSSNNSISGNNIANNGSGIWLSSSSNNSISGNNIANNDYGIVLSSSSNNSISGNNIANNGSGIWLYSSSNNRFYHNNFIDNTQQVYNHVSGYANVWDDGYPSGGNYWSDYAERYPDATEIDDSGIWDTPYYIDDYNQDNYPLMEPRTLLPATIDELKAEIEELGSEGEIDNQSIVRSLIAKLNVAQKLVDNGKIDQAKKILNAFINEVQAQSGKHITPEAADFLIESAEYILSHL